MISTLDCVVDEKTDTDVSGRLDKEILRKAMISLVSKSSVRKGMNMLNFYMFIGEEYGAGLPRKEIIPELLNLEREGVVKINKDVVYPLNIPCSYF